MKRYGYWVISFLLLILLVSACAAPEAGAPASGDWDKVLEAARKEGTVSFYTTWGITVQNVAVEAMKPYGIKAEVLGGRGGGLEERVGTEQRSGSYVADVLATGWTNNVNAFNNGYVQPVTVPLPVLQEKGVWVTPTDKYLSTHGTYITGKFITPSIVINTDLVGLDEITSMQDLLDPKWKGKIVMTDPRMGSGPGTSGFGFSLLDQMGQEYWNKMATQDITLVANYQQPVADTALGAYSILMYPSGDLTVRAIREGAPLHPVPIKEGDQHYMQGINMIANAPHPNAALVLINWYLSREGQELLCEATGYYSIRTDVETVTVDEFLPSRFNFGDLPNNLDASRNPAVVEAAKALFP
jgi:iron(III) transport system substrate-binding protein